jgi:hypothetical protein
VRVAADITCSFASPEAKLNVIGRLPNPPLSLKRIRIHTGAAAETSVRSAEPANYPDANAHQSDDP